MVRYSKEHSSAQISNIHFGNCYCGVALYATNGIMYALSKGVPKEEIIDALAEAFEELVTEVVVNERSE